VPQLAVALVGLRLEPLLLGDQPVEPPLQQPCARRELRVRRLERRPVEGR